MHLIVGNHDAYYKNSNEINSVELLLKEYDNVVPYSKAYRSKHRWTWTFCLFLGYVKTMRKKLSNLLKRQTARSMMGHLGFQRI